MKTNTPSLSERRREVLAEISQIPLVIEGTLTQRERKRGSAPVSIYHQLQRWRKGHNDTRHIPADRVGQIRSGIEGHRRVQALVAEMARLDESAVLAPIQADSKKKSTKP